MKDQAANFLQSPEWAKVNQAIGHEVINLELKNGDRILCIIKNAKRGRYLEIPGGPLINWSDDKEIKEAFAKITTLAKEHHCVFVRFRPQLINTSENRAKVAITGAHPAPFHLHAEHTVIINLEKSEEELLADMRRQTRYEVRRAGKLGLIVKSSTEKQAFLDFHQVQLETAKRQNFIPPTKKDLLAYHEAFKENAIIYSVFTEDNLVAQGLILVNGEEADYFEAASTDLNRKLPGAYALEWQVIKDMKKRGLKRYNLWGIAPPNQPHHRYAGVTTFKTGFGGEVVEFIPAQDIVIDHLKYLGTKLIEEVRKKRRHL